MIVHGYKTHKITKKDTSIFPLLDAYLPPLKEKSIVAIASTIVGITEGRIVKIHSKEQKDELIEQEAQYYLPREFSQYGFTITINRNMLVGAAGIDESNGNGYYVLWPEDPQKSANAIREYLVKKHHISSVGVILTDSKLTPLRWGVTGTAISHSGFRALNSYIGKPDLFGRKMQAEQSNIPDTLAASAVGVMGEGAEQMPLAVLTDIPFVHFQKQNPTQKELDSLKIAIGDDIYSSLLTNVKWRQGKQGKPT